MDGAIDHRIFGSAVPATVPDPTDHSSMTGDTAVMALLNAASSATALILRGMIAPTPAAIGAYVTSSMSGSTAAEPNLPVQGLPVPAVDIAGSVTPDYLICLEDGRRLKLLARHLKAKYRLTPAQYRAKWQLPDDYPMVASTYSSQRSAIARRIGLGRRD